MKIHCFQHVQFETPAMITEWAKERGHTLRTFTRFYRDDYTIPQLDDYDALLIMGGPMGVDDYYSCPWLQEELTHIAKAIGAGKHVLGICLGAQLIAKSLGADVRPHRNKEIGWYSVTKTPKGERSTLLTGLRKTHTVFHWHGDRFDIPTGARHIMQSKACLPQAFSYEDRVLGLQYHLEMDEAAIERILSHCADELVKGMFIQTPAQIRRGMQKHQTKDILYHILDKWSVGAPPGRKRRKHS